LTVDFGMHRLNPNDAHVTKKVRRLTIHKEWDDKTNVSLWGGKLNEIKSSDLVFYLLGQRHRPLDASLTRDFHAGHFARLFAGDERAVRLQRCGHRRMGDSERR
jgi:hypothetical protein